MKRGEEWLPERSELERICRANGLKLIDVARNPDWNETLYRDGLHPTATGNAVLARILTRAIQDRLHP
jgi:lysophospholipase L1-like esterase